MGFVPLSTEVINDALTYPLQSQFELASQGTCDNAFQCEYYFQNLPTILVPSVSYQEDRDARGRPVVL